MGKTYKYLVFDVGNVLLGYRWKDMLIDRGMSPDEADKFYHMMFDDHLWKELDLEYIPYDEVIELFVKKYPDREEDIRWFLTTPELMPVDRPGVWEAVHKLKEKGYKIFILSNYSGYLFMSHTIRKPFMKDIDGKVVSYQIHAAKPDAEIFMTLFSRYDLKPEEGLFFDDTELNVEASRDFGMDAILVTDEESLIKDLNKLLNED